MLQKLRSYSTISNIPHTHTRSIYLHKAHLCMAKYVTSLCKWQWHLTSGNAISQYTCKQMLCIKMSSYLQLCTFNQCWLELWGIIYDFRLISDCIPRMFRILVLSTDSNFQWISIEHLEHDNAEWKYRVNKIKWELIICKIHVKSSNSKMPTLSSNTDQMEGHWDIYCCLQNCLN